MAKLSAYGMSESKSCYFPFICKTEHWQWVEIGNVLSTHGTVAAGVPAYLLLYAEDKQLFYGITDANVVKIVLNSEINIAVWMNNNDV